MLGAVVALRFGSTSNTKPIRTGYGALICCPNLLAGRTQDHSICKRFAAALRNYRFRMAALISFLNSCFSRPYWIAT